MNRKGRTEGMGKMKGNRWEMETKWKTKKWGRRKKRKGMDERVMENSK